MNLLKKFFPEPVEKEKVYDWRSGYECKFCKYLSTDCKEVCPLCGNIEYTRTLVAIRLHEIYINDGLYESDIVRRYWEKK